METGISINGGTVDREGVKAVVDGVVLILAAGHEYHAEQDTIQAALNTLGQLTPRVEGTQISDVTISG